VEQSMFPAAQIKDKKKCFVQCAVTLTIGPYIQQPIETAIV